MKKPELLEAAFPEIVFLLLIILFILAFVGAIAWWSVAQWNECRGMGLSIFYCIKHVL